MDASSSDSDLDEDDGEPCTQTVTMFSSLAMSSSMADSIRTMSAERTALSNCMVFSHPSLLRAADITTIMANQASILEHGTGCETSYDMSQPAESIDVFISHNWSTPRHQKFKALALFFNRRAAVVACGIVCTGLVVATALGALPLQEILPYVQDRFDDNQVGGYCLFVGPPVFIIFLVCWQDMKLRICRHRRRCVRSETVFLDKCCIHQTDMHLKEEGINKLAGFLYCSGSMLIVFGESYLSKLWTVYELASFLALRPNQPIHIIPLMIPDVVWLGTLLWWVFLVFDQLIRTRAIHDALESSIAFSITHWLISATVLPYALAISRILRQWFGQLNGVWEQVRCFDIAKAVCLEEADRPVVHGNIAVFMRVVGLCESSEPSEALEEFNSLIRRKVPWSIYSAVGRTGVLYQHVVMILMPQLMLGLDIVAAHVSNNKDLKFIFVMTLYYLNFYLCILPLVFALISWITLKFLKVEGCASWAGSFLAAVAAIIFGVGSKWALHWLRHKAWSSRPVWLANFVVAIAACTVMTILVYRPLREPKPAKSSKGIASSDKECLQLDDVITPFGPIGSLESIGRFTLPGSEEEEEEEEESGSDA